MKRTWVLALLAVVLVAMPAAADFCTIEAAPAATLLLPYFEVNIGDTSGIDTFFSINNASDESIMTHVILWTDLSVEALDFNVYLTGYDVQTIGLGLIIRNGVLPVTGDANQYSNRGAFSGLHPGEQDEVDGYPGCAAIDFPYDEPELSEEFLDQHLRPILTGGPSAFYSGRCGAVDHGDDIARGYVTVDITNDCTLLRPCDPGYFFESELGADDQVGEYDNVLWGDWYMVDGGQNFAQGDTLVHVQAIEFASAPPERDGAFGRIPGEVGGVPVAFFTSFYSRCSLAVEGPQGGRDAQGEPSFYIGFADFREPLGTTYATRFYQNDAFSGGTDLLVWRDSNVNALLGEENGFDCDDGRGWYLNERQVVIFDEEENPNIPDACPVSPCPDPDEFTLFPYEAQRVSIGDQGFAPESGWLFLNLNQTRAYLYDAVLYEYVCEGDCVINTQAWVQSVHSADGRFSVGLSAVQLDTACSLESVLLGADTDTVDYPVVEFTYPASYQSSYYY